MCSICGIIKNEPLTSFETTQVEEMNTTLTHRGPDSAGYFSAKNVGVAMRRLSIIDLEGGQQPLFNEDKTIALIINGEIYNYIELREELQAKGHTFTTASDCETVLHTYEEYGDNFTHHLRGMFAFCLHDKVKNKIILGRDRLGEKPLYLYETDGMLAFSSEMKALLPLITKEKRALNQDAIYTYFFYQYIPDPLTAFKEVRKLPPATILEVDLSNFSKTERKYWTMQDAAPAYNDRKDEVRDVLNDIEKIIIRSDVPVGVSLSGGIDSSVIAILSARYKKNLHAFSIGYAGRPENDERLLAKSLAEKLGMKFHDIELSKDEFVRDFEDMIFALDDPIADIAAYGYYRVSQKAKEVGVPVLLAGFGGDELFGGYPWAVRSITYNKLKQKIWTRFTLLRKLLLGNKRVFARSPFRTISKALRQSFGQGYLCYDLTPEFDFTAQNQEKIFTDSFLKKRARTLPYSFFAQRDLRQPETETPMLLEEFWMLSNCIPLGDRLSMAHSVELRLPLLDHVLVEKVLGIYKAKKETSTSKQWLTEAMGSDLPKEIVKRKKRGFTPPTALWINEIVQKNRERMLGGYLVKNEIINRSFIERALSNPREYQDFLYKTLVLETWITRYLQK